MVVGFGCWHSRAYVLLFCWFVLAAVFDLGVWCSCWWIGLFLCLGLVVFSGLMFKFWAVWFVW